MNARRQGRIGLGLAALFAGAWLAIHFTAVFDLDLARTSLPAILFIILVQAWLATGLFIVAHDAMHGSLAPAWPRMQDRTGQAALMIYAGLDYRLLKRKHFDHHKYVGSVRDPDFNAADPHRFGPWIARFVRSYYTHAQLLRISAVVLLYLLLGAGLLNIALFWAAPALLALGQLFFFGTYLPHRHGRPFADRHNARSTPLPDALSFLTCFHFGGYHHEHHIHPGEPWWRLPASRVQPGAKLRA